MGDDFGDYGFLSDALKGGTVTFVKRYPDERYNRFAVTVGNVTKMVNVSDELWEMLEQDAANDSRLLDAARMRTLLLLGG